MNNNTENMEDKFNSEIIGSWYYTGDTNHKIDIKQSGEDIEAYIGTNHGTYDTY